MRVFNVLELDTIIHALFYGTFFIQVRSRSTNYSLEKYIPYYVVHNIIILCCDVRYEVSVSVENAWRDFLARTYGS